jgi:hypothetical protein
MSRQWRRGRLLTGRQVRRRPVIGRQRPAQCVTANRERWPTRWQRQRLQVQAQPRLLPLARGHLRRRRVAPMSFWVAFPSTLNFKH